MMGACWGCETPKDWSRASLRGAHWSPDLQGQPRHSHSGLSENPDFTLDFSSNNSDLSPHLDQHSKTPRKDNSWTWCLQMSQRCWDRVTALQTWVCKQRLLNQLQETGVDMGDKGFLSHGKASSLPGDL